MKLGARIASLVISDIRSMSRPCEAAREAISLNKVIYTAPEGIAALDGRPHVPLAARGRASVPGTSFYTDAVGETLTRFCFAKEDDVLEEAARRLRAL